MQTLETPIATLLEPLSKQRLLEQATMLSQMRSSSARSWLASRLPLLERSIAASADPSPQELASHPLDELDDWQKRLEQCATCPPEGGACDSRLKDELLCSEGHVPVWADGKFLSKRCSKWREYTLRRYLATIGVPERHLGARFPTDADRALLNPFVHSGTSMILTGPARSGKTHLAVAALAAVIVLKPDRRRRGLRFASVPRLIEETMRAMRSDDDGTLLRAAAEAPTLVLDDFGAGRPTEWSNAALCQLVKDRIEESRATLITAESVQKLQRVFGEDFARRLDGSYTKLEGSLIGDKREWKIAAP